jgi:hypothetical protein
MIDLASLENVRLTHEERQAYRLAMLPEDIAELSPTERLKYERTQLEGVYGESVTFHNDPETGARVPREVGIGSASQQTHNHRVATAKFEKDRSLNEAILAAALKG